MSVLVARFYEEKRVKRFWRRAVWWTFVYALWALILGDFTPLVVWIVGFITGAGFENRKGRAS